MVDQPVRIACGSALGKDEGDDGYAQDLADAIEALHQRYMESAADMRRDAEYILEATELLMAGCFPAAMAGQTV